ncbi:BTAD domain-containing putative transcriptional regulator [Streptomyces sp. NPDC046237]|uniref:BTAD domain-containing putative transcriptional regulator n=1 Tax=Streptomyces sp. NPDC046237 TaxID=3154914 RepID=UPI003410FBC6
MRYSVLGPTQVHTAHGAPVALGGARLRALLTVLALRAGRTVPVSVLVDEVWAGDQPADAGAALQALVGRLRRALGREAVESSPGGYRLAAGPEDVDAQRFERLAGEGGRALGAGDPGRAAELLDEALGLWRGPALADLPDRTAEAARWETRRLDTRRARFDAALALGDGVSVLPELFALCEAHPLDEPLQALRIRALRDTGRAAEALAAYDAVRRDLADRLGTTPSPPLRALHAELLSPEAGPTGPGQGRTPHEPLARAGNGPGSRDDLPGTGAPAGAPGRGVTRPSAATAPAQAANGASAGPAGHGGSAAPAQDATAGPAAPAGPSGSVPLAPPGSAQAANGGPGAPGDGSVARAAIGPAPGAGVAARRSGPDGSVAPVTPGPAQAADGGPAAPGGADGSVPPAALGPAQDATAGPVSADGSVAPAPLGPAPGAGVAARRSGPDGSVAPMTPGPAQDANGASASADGSVPPATPGPAQDDATASPAAPADAGGSVPLEAPGPAQDADGGPGPAGPGGFVPPGGPRPARVAPGGLGGPAGHGGAWGSAAPGSAHAPAAGRDAEGLADPGRTVGPPRPGNLRARLTSFVGRGQDIARLRDDLHGSRLVTLLGPGGAGKTRLSQEGAERAAGAGAWPDGVWLAELAPVTDPEAVAEAVLGAVGARETVLRGAGAEELRGTDTPLGRLVEHCAARRLLLILDNCEHVVDAAAALAESLLARCPGVTVLATSREPLGVPGEFLRPVEPLPPESALRLLGERGAAARPGFDPGDDPEACAEICRRLDGLPLAIELAAARLRLLTPRQIADRLDDRFRLLTSGARTVLPRQQTLRAVVDWSWDLLDASERAVLRRLSAFTGGCGLEAAEAVCTAPVGPAGEASEPAAPHVETLDVLGSLVDKSLVVAAPADDGTMRYRLLETVAEYAGERLDEAGERAEIERRHLVHYRELARGTDPELRSGGQRRAVAWFRTEYENLRTALRRAVAVRDEHEALVLVHCLIWYWQLRDLRADALHWAEEVAALGPDPFAPPAVPAVPLHEPCTATPPPLSEEQLWEARRGVRLIELLNMDYETGGWTSPEGSERLRRITAVYRPGLPQTCRMPGSFAVFAVLLIGEGGRMREVLDATVEACRAFGYEWELANALQTRANLLANRSDLAAEAAADAEESLKIFVRLDDAWGAAEALSSRGEARERQRRYEGAAEDFAAAIGYAERIGAQTQKALLRARYADMLAVTGHEEEAEVILREVLEAGENRGHEPVLAARLFLAMLLGRTGRTAEARQQLTGLLEDFSSDTLSIFAGFTLGGLAWLDNLDGQYAPALDLAREALDRSLSTLSMMVAPQMPALHLVTAAWALAGLARLGGPGGHGGHDATIGARLLGAYRGLLPEGHLLSPPERENLEQATALARSVLGDKAFEAAYAEGGGLSLEEATALLARTDAINGRAES